MKDYPTYKLHIRNIDIVYEEVFEKWCKQHCEGICRMRISRYAAGDNADIYLTFIKEEDAVAFKLRWM